MLRRKGILITIIIMVVYASLAIYSDINQVIRNFQKIELLYIFLILVLVTASLLVKSIRQFFFLKQIRIKISFTDNIILYFAGLSLLVTPAGMGGIIKSHFLHKNHNESISKTAPMIIVERYHDALGLFSLTVLFSFIGNIEILRIPIIGIGILLLTAIIIIKNRKLFLVIQEKMTRIRFLKKFENNSTEFNSSLFSFFDKKSLFYGWVISIAAWFLDAIAIFLCFKAFGLNFDFILTTTFGFSSILFGAVSLIPGGVGVTEFSFIQLLSSHGVDLSIATALVFFIRLTSIWYVTCIGFVATKLVSKRDLK